MVYCEWLPDLFKYDDLFSNFGVYDEAVYRAFKRDFIESCPTFLGKKVVIRKHPKVNDKEQTYYHITSKNYDANKERDPDIFRCERIKWVRAFIENYDCNKATCYDCEGIKCWTVPYKNAASRSKIFFEEMMYLVILENRPDYCLLVTAYPVDSNHTVRKLLKEFNNAKSAS